MYAYKLVFVKGMNDKDEDIENDLLYNIFKLF